MILQGLELIDALGADRLALILGQVVAVTAEDTAHSVFLHHDRTGLGKELDGISGVYLKFFAQRLGDYDTPELVNFTYQACRSHKALPFQIYSLSKFTKNR